MISREEQMLAKIASGETIDNDCICRRETFLRAIANNEGAANLPEPICREEYYYSRIAEKGVDRPDQTKSINPTTSQQIITPDSGYELASVTVNAVTSEIDSNIQAENIKKDTTILGVTGTYEGIENVMIDRSITTLTVENLSDETKIGQYAFAGCEDLTEATIPDNITLIENYAFYGCSNLTKITMEATTPPVLENVNAIPENALIKVPTESLEAYKTASVWSEIADQIVLSFPFNDASWDEISEVSSQISTQALTSAQVEENYGWKIGDTKTETLTTGEVITLRIIGFNHDTLSSDHTTKAGITLQMVDCLATTYQMNTSNTNYGGWADSKMRTQTMPTIKATLPDSLQNVIKLVDKKAADGGDFNYNQVDTTSDDLFLLAGVEIFGSASSYGYAEHGNDEGTQYEYWVGKAAADRIKKYDNDADGVPETATNWWERSSYKNITGAFCSVDSGGGASYTIANISCGVAFGFCI